MTEAKSKANEGSTKGETNDKGQGVDSHIPSRSERAEIKTDENYEAATTGAVLDKNDGRLKENRDAGVSLGTTAHSASASKVERSGEAPKA